MQRHLAIGDIHGCYDALRTLIEMVAPNSDDVLITLGDYCDRGPNTCAVIDWLIYADQKYNLKPLRGNHDIMMLDARHDESELNKWLDVGGANTLQSYSPFEGQPGRMADIPEDHWKFLNEKLIPYFESESHFFVHANAYPDLGFNDQPDFMLYWEQYNDPPRHESGKFMVCGHTSQKSGLPKHNQNSICIDTWACGKGWLSCLHVESGKIWQATQSGQTRSFAVDELE